MPLPISKESFLVQQHRRENFVSGATGCHEATSQQVIQERRVYFRHLWLLRSIIEQTVEQVGVDLRLEHRLLCLVDGATKRVGLYSVGGRNDVIGLLLRDTGR